MSAFIVPYSHLLAPATSPTLSLLRPQSACSLLSRSTRSCPQPFRTQRFTRTLPCMSDESPSPLINVPSGVLLLLSSVLAIAFIGSVFEVSGGHPTYGMEFTRAVLVVSLPGFLFLFYSAVRKGQQEALDDS